MSMVTQLVGDLVTAATALLGQLPTIFNDVFAIIFDVDSETFTLLGAVLVGTAGFALAWAGIRIVISYVGKLLNASRGGRR